MERNDYSQSQIHTVYCWGNNNQGQLGDDTTTNSPTPVPAIGT